MLRHGLSRTRNAGCAEAFRPLETPALREPRGSPGPTSGGYFPDLRVATVPIGDWVWRHSARIKERRRAKRSRWKRCLERLPQLLRWGSVPQLRKLVVNEARAFLVPEFSASEHCRGCSTAGTISGRTLYQIVDVEDGTRSPAPPPMHLGFPY